MRILVTGGSSVIGTKVVKHLLENNIDVEFTYYKNHVDASHGKYLDITQEDSCIKLINELNPDIIIHCVALTNVDLCETNNELAELLNVKSTSNIIKGCKTTKSKIVYISTSFVFDGKKQQYSEEDRPSPSTYYGITKFKGEQLVKESSLPFLILRTDQPYCWTEKWQHTNSVLRVIDTLKAGKILKEITDWYNTPTYVPDFALATRKLIQNNATGIYHITGSEYINRYDWALRVTDVFELDRELIEPITSEMLNLPAKRVNVNLSNQKLFEETGMRMMNINEGLMAMYNSKSI